MPIIAKKAKSNFTPCPEGLWQAVCCDVVDKGMEPTAYGPKHKIQIRWLCDAQPPRTDGKPHMVSGKWNLTMGKKSKLRAMLQVWIGKNFTEDAAYRFDIESVIGMAAQVQVAHGEGEEGPYAFAQVVLKAIPGMPRVQIPSDYVRECNRPGYQAPKIEEVQEEELEPEFDPFAEAEETTPF